MHPQVACTTVTLYSILTFLWMTTIEWETKVRCLFVTVWFSSLLHRLHAVL